MLATLLETSRAGHALIDWIVTLTGMPIRVGWDDWCSVFTWWPGC